jgi:hypothetical protein
MRLLRLNNGDNPNTNEFVCNFNDDIIFEPNSKIGLISAQIPLSNSIVIDNFNNTITWSTNNGQDVYNVPLENNSYTDIAVLLNMITNAINSNLIIFEEYKQLNNQTATGAITAFETDCMGMFVFITSNVSGITTFKLYKNNFIQPNLSISNVTGHPSKLSVANNIITCVQNPTGIAPNEKFSYNYAVCRQPIQITSSAIQCVILPDDDATKKMGGLKLGICSNIPNLLNAKEVNYVKYMGTIQVNTTFKLAINGVEENIPGIIDNAVLPLDILSIEFTNNYMYYVIYRPSAVQAGQYVRYVIKNEPWAPNVLSFFYLAVSLYVNFQQPPEKTFTVSVPQVIMLPIVQTVSNNVIVNKNDSTHILSRLDENILEPITFDTLPTELIDDDGNTIPLEYDNSDNLTQPIPTPTPQSALQINLGSIANNLGFTQLPIVNLVGQQAVVNSSNPYTFTTVPKSVIVELLNITSMESYDSTQKQRRDIVSIIPRYDLTEAKLLIYESHIPLMIDINNMNRMNIRNFRVRLSDYNDEDLATREVSDLVFVIE